ncbi:MAG: hypothetical protein EAZ08_09570 [Cytophagales bacterium]|nr:MAG: hypothetical protein EAZ08_09570 [Cytophagales bacterium]
MLSFGFTQKLGKANYSSKNKNHFSQKQKNLTSDYTPLPPRAKLALPHHKQEWKVLWVGK